jgi:GT2 family glycosyltransferase
MSQPGKIDVSVILVGLNAREFVEKCIESVQAAHWEGCTFEVVYVDNGSTDGSAAAVRARFPDVALIENQRNVGYCPAANQGARIARGRLLFFLNDDTLVVDNAIALAAAFLDSVPDAGVVGSRLLNLDGSDQWSGRRFPSPWNGLFSRRSALARLFPSLPWLRDYLCRTETLRGVPFEADWVSAAAMMVPASVFWRVGGLAEDYYYWHEAVFCDRVRRAGLRIYLHPQSRIVHYEGKGSGARPYRVRKWHIVNFHVGAFRCYCEHFQLGIMSPSRWLAGAALFARAALLLVANRLGSKKI